MLSAFTQFMESTQNKQQGVRAYRSRHSEGNPRPGGVFGGFDSLEAYMVVECAPRSGTAARC